MTKGRIIARGAEAVISDNDSFIIKKRIKKTYRIVAIDLPLRLRRTRKEVKSLQKAKSLGLNVPSVLGFDEDAMEIALEKIPGKKIRDFLSKKNIVAVCRIVAEDVAKLHNAGLIHGDLTTSNMVKNSTNGKIYLIDFGLSFVSDKIEDKAVDLHLLKRALESKHHLIWQKCWSTFLKYYSKNIFEKEKILQKLEEVEMRGRNKH
jgi:TP53 regulating kinase and related kinases